MRVSAEIDRSLSKRNTSTRGLPFSRLPSVVRRPRTFNCGLVRFARHRITSRMLLVLACMILTGCESESQEQTDMTTESTPITRAVERGSVTLEVTLSRDEITIADELRLTIEVVAEDGVDVEMPQFGEQLSEFTIRDYRKWSGVPEDGRRRWKQQYDLDIYLSGDYEIPPITARFIDRRGPEDGTGKVIESEITSEPIAIKVNSLLEGEFDPTQFRDIKGLVELPAEPDWTVAEWIAGLGVAALLVTAMALWMWRQRAADSGTPAVPPHRWAFEQLDELERQQLPALGRTHEFYFLLSGILRGYIERRFSLRAPEQTTGEFLDIIQDHALFTPDQKNLLREFLQACDMVKFALHEPPEVEITIAFATAREFVDQTMDVEQIHEEAA